MNEPVVYVVDGDTVARNCVEALVRSKNIAVESFSSAIDFLEHFDRSRYGCVVADTSANGTQGVDLPHVLKREEISLPVIVVSHEADVPTAVSTLLAGASGFLQKPFSEQELWQNIARAIKWHRKRHAIETRRAELEERMARLTPHEKIVMEKLVDGTPNKVIASQLEMGLRTVELRRATIMKKLDVRSLAELVRVVVELKHYQDCDTLGS